MMHIVHIDIYTHTRLRMLEVLYCIYIVRSVHVCTCVGVYVACMHGWTDGWLDGCNCVYIYGICTQARDGYILVHLQTYVSASHVHTTTDPFVVAATFVHQCTRWVTHRPNL